MWKPKNLSRSAIERLLPCIIDSQKLPKDILKTAYYKLSNKPFLTALLGLQLPEYRLLSD